MATVLVTGGTGVLGSRVVRRLLDRGDTVRVLSRRHGALVIEGADVVGGNLDTGDGLREATSGIDAIVHCASATKTPRYAKARMTDVDGTERLLASARSSGQPHVVFISIVGIDRIPLGYYRAKRETEEAVSRSGLPHTILRTTQFHDLIFDTLQRVRRIPGALIVPKGFRFQPVEADEVAERMVTLLGSGPSGRATDMGGPAVRRIEDLALAYLTATGVRKPVLSIHMPGRVARRFREGHNLAPEHTDGTVVWEDFLRRRVPLAD